MIACLGLCTSVVFFFFSYYPHVCCVFSLPCLVCSCERRHRWLSLNKVSLLISNSIGFACYNLPGLQASLESRENRGGVAVP